MDMYSTHDLRERGEMILMNCQYKESNNETIPINLRKTQEMI